MMRRDPYRRPPDTRALREALAQTRRAAEQAIEQRDAALRALKQAVSERDAALERAARSGQAQRVEQAPRVEHPVRVEHGPQAEQARPVEPATRPEPDPRVARLAADLANVRRVRDEQIARARTEERASGLLALAQVQDDLVRSLESNPDRESPWYQGHAAILGNVRKAIRAAGGSEVGRVGERFDPTVHEAIATGEGPAGTVIAVARVGLRLDDGTLVRPAQVRVAA